MIKEIIFLILLTFLPIGELRLAIPVGILSHNLLQTQLNPLLVFIVCVSANIVLGIILFKLLMWLNKYLIQIPKIKYFLDRAHKKLKPFTEKYGAIGVALFVSIPLPGSGSWTAALGSYVLGIEERKFYLANAVGVTIAGILVTAITLGIIG